ncbi:DUF3592 domain-containing protein [Actinomadura sp. 6N118]|uniref:DUF3592 domain-containing protein n=1 Tax=Actinomadura sp. 6N118 TaxID=3375151 RepID=UPI0037AD9381
MVFLAVFGAVTLLLGLTFVVIATALTRSERRFARTGIQVAGNVVGEEQHTRRSQSGVTVYYHPVIEYQTADGHLLRASTEVNAQRRHTIGTQVKIRYLPDAPTRIRLVGETLLRRISAIFLGVGALFTLLGLILLTVWLIKITG